MFGLMKCVGVCLFLFDYWFVFENCFFVVFDDVFVVYW